MRGKELQAIRRKLGLTQVELAKALRVDSNAVARRERDERTITGCNGVIDQESYGGAQEARLMGAKFTSAKKLSRLPGCSGTI